MTIRTYRVEYGSNMECIDITAPTFDAALLLAKQLRAKELREEPENYEITNIELIASSDYDWNGDFKGKLTRKLESAK